MTTLEVFLLVAGIVCIVVSFIMPSAKNMTEAVNIPSIEPEITEYQREIIRRKIEESINQELENVVEKTEISLDKISNTKILEMQEYADTILGEMNRNHNETMFLYDMLNDKSKEIKLIVRNINNAMTADNRQVSAAAREIAVSQDEEGSNDSEIIEKLFVQAANEEAGEIPDDDGSMNVNENILRLYRSGKSVLEIAKELNLGVGQTKLVIDLSKGTN